MVQPNTPKKKGESVFDYMNREFLHGLMDRYTNLAVNVFDWEGTPFPRVYPERILFDEGLATVFIPDGTDTPVCAMVAQESISKNWYGEPVSWRAIPVAGNAFSNQKLTPDNAVLIRNSDTYTPTRPYVEALARQMVNVEMTMRMNVNAQKFPFMFESTDGNKVLQQKNDFMALMECTPVFFKTDFSDVPFKVLNNNVPVITADLCALYTEYDARILEYIGVNNLPIEKKERLLTDEVTVNQEELSLAVKGRLEQRRIACDAMKDILGMDCSVRLSGESVRAVVEEPDGGEPDDGSGVDE